MQKTIKIILGSIWFLVVAWFFFIENHPYYLGSFSYIEKIIIGVIVFALTCGIISGVNVLLNKFFKKPLLEIRVSAVKIIIAMVFIALASLAVLQISNDIAVYRGGIIFKDAESWGLLPEGAELEDGMELVLADKTVITDSDKLTDSFPAELQSSFTQVGLLKSSAFVAGKILLGLLAILTLNMVAFAFGKKILKEKYENNKILEFVFNTAIGLAIIMLSIFVLGFFNVASFMNIAIVLAFMLVISPKEALSFLKLLIKESAPIANAPPMSLFVILGGILIMAYNLLGIIRPMPIGWDDSNYYLYIPKVLAHLHSLLDGVGGMYNWELINVIASFSNDAFLPLMINFWGGILALIAIYMIANLVLDKEQSLMTAAVFYTFPSVIFQSSMDLKNDLALLFFELAAFYALVIWIKSNKLKWLTIAGILIGVCVGIKATAGMAFIIMFGLVLLKILGKYASAGIVLVQIGILMLIFGKGNLYEISPIIIEILGIVMIAGGTLGIIFNFYKTYEKKNALKKIGIFLLAVFLSIFPWILKNTIIDHVPLRTGYLASAPDVTILNYSSFVDKCDNESLNGEFDIYITGGGNDRDTTRNLFSLLKMPWQMTMNPGFDGIYIDISCIFLGLLPIIIWYLIERKEEKLFRLAMLWTAVYFSIMIFFFNGVPWYGFLGYITFLILIFKILKTQKKDNWQNEKMLSVISSVAIIITVAMGIFVKISSSTGLDDLAYLGNIVTKDEYIESINPGVLETREVLGSDTDASGSTIYKVGGATRYFLADLDFNYAYDEALDIYTCLDAKYTAQELVGIFQEMGITYVAFDYTTLIEGKVAQTILDRYYAFLLFGYENLEAVVETSDFALFKIPTE